MNILSKIVQYKKTEVEKQKHACGLSLEQLREMCDKLPPVKSFNIAKGKISLIAEVKKASPSKGIIRENFNPVEIAIAYERAGASAISVLTDEKFFQGSISYLEEVRKCVKLPILRKDFIIDPFQIYQTRLMGADLILLIASCLEYTTMKQYYEIAKSIGLEVLVEVHDEEELNAALKLGAKLVGINNRNLETFEVSIYNTINLIKNRTVPDVYFVSESGIYTGADVMTLRDAGVSGILVGESLMRQENVEKAVTELLQEIWKDEKKI